MTRYTPDKRPIANPGGFRRDRTMFRWLMRAVSQRPRPERGTVNARTGRVKFHHRWKGGLRAK